MNRREALRKSMNGKAAGIDDVNTEILNTENCANCDITISAMTDRRWKYCKILSNWLRTKVIFTLEKRDRSWQLQKLKFTEWNI
jgi:hypothetical protein